MEHDEKRAITGLSAEAKTRLEQFIKIYDPINNRTLRQNGSSQASGSNIRDKRLPVPGSVITKVYKGTRLSIKVLDKGFEYEGKYYRTLSRLANTISGCRNINGYMFFGL
jgi:hypothetical protein